MTPPRPLWRTFLGFLGPMMLANLLQSLSGTINNVYLGQMIGVKALAAATVFFPVMFFFIAFNLGLGSGASVLIGQAWGARDLHKVKAIAGSALFVSLAGGGVVALGAFFAEPLMRALGTPADILVPASDYARIMLISMPAFFAFLLFTSMLRGVGDTVTPLWSLALSTVVGLVITPALIQGWGGLPRLGVASAAYAGLASLAAALGWLFFQLRRRGHPLAPDAEFLRQVRPRWTILRLVLRLGVPTALQMVTMAVAELVLLGLVNGFGSQATAAYGAVNQVLAYVQFPAMSIAIAASILGAQAIGAGQINQLGAITRMGVMLNLIMTGGGVALVYLLSRPVVGLFITDPAVVELTQTLLHIVLWSVVVFGVGGVFSGVMRASGAVLAPTVLTIVPVVLVEAPTAWLLSRHMGVTGVWIAYPVTFCAICLLQAGYYRLVWSKQTVTRLI